MQRNLALLETLHKAPAHIRRVILARASPDLISALCEIAINVLYGRVPLTTKQYNQLNKNKRLIRLIADKKVKTVKKKRLITQHGSGFILPLLSAAIPFITSLFSR